MNICNVKWEVGSHISFSKSITPSVSEAIHRGMYALQFFMGNPRSSFKRQIITEKDLKDTKVLTERYPMHIFSHFPYSANFAGKAAKNGLAWNGNSEVDNRLTCILRALEYELSILANFKSEKSRSGVVIHPGSYPDREKGHKTVADTINKINFTENSILLLENCAGEGNKLCRTFEEIGSILYRLDKSQKKHVKVCIDTAHIWGQGDYDLTKIDEIDRMFDEFEETIGLENFYLLHLNDSKVELGARRDLHELIGKGCVWKNDFTSLIYLLDKCNTNGIPAVLETHPNDMITLSRLSRLSEYTANK